MNNVIPSLGYKPGNGWEQPELDDIEVTDTHAILYQKDFDKLKEYSKTLPTGKYEGIMWKCREPNTDNWHLCWFKAAAGDRGLMGYVDVDTRAVILKDLIDLLTGDETPEED